MKKKFSGPKVLGIILMVLLAISVFSLLVMTLWNNILAPVLNISTVSFWQAAGILLLSKILFGGFRGGGPWRSGRYGWGQQMRDKWQHLSPEEKERMKSEWRDRCGRGSWRSSATDSPGETEHDPNKIT